MSRNRYIRRPARCGRTSAHASHSGRTSVHASRLGSGRACRDRMESRHLGGSKNLITEFRAGGDETRERTVWIERREDRLVAMVKNPAVALFRRLLRHPNDALRERRNNQHPPRVDRLAIFHRHAPPHPARQNHHDRRPAIRQQQLQHVAFQCILKPTNHARWGRRSTAVLPYFSSFLSVAHYSII